MLKRIDLLTVYEATEVKRLQAKMLHSKSISETNIYQKELHEIVEAAEKRYFESGKLPGTQDETISRIEHVRREGKEEGIMEVIQSMLDDGYLLKEVIQYTPYDEGELRFLLEHRNKIKARK